MRNVLISLRKIVKFYYQKNEWISHMVIHNALCVNANHYNPFIVISTIWLMICDLLYYWNYFEHHYRCHRQSIWVKRKKRTSVVVTEFKTGGSSAMHEAHVWQIPTVCNDELAFWMAMLLPGWVVLTTSHPPQRRWPKLWNPYSTWKVKS